MQVILLERIAKLGQMGDIVTVKAGYARNFLLPMGKALRANEENKKYFDSQKAELEARNLERKQEAEKIKEKLDGQSYVLIRSAGQTGQLYGSVSSRDITATLDENGFKVARNQVSLTSPIKVIGIHDLQVILHPEVDAKITVNVARSEDEAVRQAAGEDLTGRESEVEEELEEETVDLAEVFENPDDVELEPAVEESEAAEETEATEGTDAPAEEEVDASGEEAEEETK